MRRFVVVVVLVVVAALAFWRLRAGEGADAPSYRMVEVTRGDLASVVTSTGTLEPVTTVQVGTQVSGIVERILADFNDKVKAGQVIARIDTTLLAAAVSSSEAQLERAEAELKQAGREYERMEPLYRDEMVSEAEFNAAQYGLDVARAGLRGARVDLDRARRNLGYATITAPIDGTVVQRSVDVGQTVQASFSAPELFQIAGDLTAMQIIVAVDESDIGQIREGQRARFTVQAWPDDTFEGTVRQVRLQSVMEDNVVNYQVVVDAANADLRLLPGMTATVDFVVDEAADVLQVANAALRYRPAQDVVQAAIEKRRAARAAQGGAGQGGAGRDGAAQGGAGSGESGQAATAQGGTAARGSGVGGERGAGGMPANRGMLWVLKDDGTLDLVMVRTGITDGTNTQIDGRDLAEGLQVIAGVASKAAEAAGSPFEQQNQRPGPPRPGGF